MNQTLRIGIIGDFKPNFRPHPATNEAIHHAAKALSLAVEISWLPTPVLNQENGEKILEQYDALWCGPGSPYESMDGALRSIRFARERNWPFVGT
jgi:CTP synthase (UTP-ammonia lyase)